ncbi:MAG: hypothetical protein ACF8Q5_10085 [Phycisphaerales bacterium JB040]
MPARTPALTAFLIASTLAAPALAQNVTFVYQGRLSDAGQPANGAYDMVARVWDAPSGGNPVGIFNTFSNVPVSDGLFQINIPDTLSAFTTTDPRYLEITVEGTALPRQFLGFTPRAGFARRLEGLSYDDSSGEVEFGVGTGAPAANLHADTGTDGVGLAGTAGPNPGLTIGSIFSNYSVGVLGQSTSSTTIFDAGVLGIVGTPNQNFLYQDSALYGLSGGSAKALVAIAEAPFGFAADIFNLDDQNQGGGLNVGVEAPGATAIFAAAYDNAGVNYALHARTSSPNGYAGYFEGGENFFEGNVGIGTDNPVYPLHITKPASRSLYIRNDGSVGSGYGAVIATEDPSGYAVWASGGARALFAQTDSSSDYAIYSNIGRNYFNNDVGIGDTQPENRLHVADFINSAASLAGHVMQIENYSTGTSTDMLVINTDTSDTTPDAGINFITFMRRGVSLGAIQGNSAGGVEFAGPGNDYAEWLPQASESEPIGPGDVVAVRAGNVSLDTTGADQIMVVSTAPIVVGNRPFEDETHDDLAGWQKVAFIGQAPVRVLGPVESGDLLIPSGLHDGTAIALSPDAITPEDLTGVLGIAWESSDDAGEKRITAAIGIDQADAAAHALRAQAQRVNDLEARLERLERTLNDQD